MSIARGLVVLLCLSAMAHADVYFEIVEDGNSPDGLVGNFPFFYSGTFDVYVWGDDGDTELGGVHLDITDEWLWEDFLQFFSLGTFGDGFEGTISSPGTLADRAIENILSYPSVPRTLPQGIENAVVFYDNFEMEFDGLVNVFPLAVETNNGSGVPAHGIGVITTPEPTSAMLFGCVIVLLRRAAGSR